jgi:hypothetical protein
MRTLHLRTSACYLWTVFLKLGAAVPQETVKFKSRSRDIFKYSGKKNIFYITDPLKN